MHVCTGQISQHSLNNTMTILLLEKKPLTYFHVFPGDLAVGSLKLRVKTQGRKCQLSAPERLKTSQEVNDITNQRICQASSVNLYYFPQKADNPGICQIDLKS